MGRIKNILLALIFAVTNLKGAGQEKKAILMVHFGTTYDDTRTRTIDSINSKAAETFPGVHVAEAYTSVIVMKRLKERGIEKSTVSRALLRLAADGYDTVVIQPTFILPGTEYDKMCREAEQMRQFFKDVRIGRPLLCSVDDCRSVMEVMANRHSEQEVNDGAVVFVGHGTPSPVNAMYSQLDYLLTSEGHPMMHVATIEGYPTFDTTVVRLKSQGAKRIRLVPLLFVSGDHSNNDIAVEWVEKLGNLGFEATAVKEGLGEIAGIQSLYIDRLRETIAGERQ